MTVALDEKDRQILLELDYNSRIPLTQLARRVRASKEVAHYRIKRLGKEGYIKKFYVILNTAKLGYYSFKVYFQFQDLSPKEERNMIAYLNRHPNVFWVATSSGKFDLLIGVWAKDVIEFDSIMLGFMNKFSKYILAKETTITKHNIQHNRNWFSEVEGRVKVSDVGGVAEAADIDETDRRILLEIANNARMPIAEIARRIGSSSTVVAYRLKKLEKSGVILSFRLSPDLKKFEYEFFKAFIYFKNLNSKRLSDFIAYCNLHPNILNVVTCVGSWDIEVEFEVESTSKFHEIINEMRLSFSDIFKSYDSVLFKREYKVSFMPGSEETMGAVESTYLY
ncbi:MAG: winged helix-turn-helix transcriptional regulator [Candidatus Micrarchaeota archaeon]